MERQPNQTNPLQGRRRRPEPADPVFTQLLHNTLGLKIPPQRRQAWNTLIDYVGTAEIDDDPDRRLIHYCASASDPLPRRDADFIASMVKIIERYEPTPKQAKWVRDIFRKLTDQARSKA
jgi:hypothetical protein